MQTTHTENVQKSEFMKYEKLFNELEGFSLRKEGIKTPYERFRFKGDGINVVMYTSGKLLVQGKRTEELIKNIGKSNFSVIEESPSKTDGLGYKAHIGVDEVGKGDYFGPMVACACYCNLSSIKNLLSLGIADSKRLSDKKIVQISQEIKKYTKFSFVVLPPLIYAQEVGKTKNVAIVLAKMHALAIESLLIELNKSGEECNEIVIDQFSSVEDRVKKELGEMGSKLKFTQFHKGESDIIVAAASILARSKFLEEWEAMESLWNFKFPKGASHVIDIGKDFVSQFGVEALNQVAKVSFKTTKQILS